MEGIRLLFISTDSKYLVSTRSTGFPPTKNTAIPSILKPSFHRADSFRGKNTAEVLSLLTHIYTVRTQALPQFQERRLVLHPAESDEILVFTDTR
jgi:hypothetical protein